MYYGVLRWKGELYIYKTLFSDHFIIVMLGTGCLGSLTTTLMLPILDDVAARGCWARHGVFL